ncbi:hypothetical protein BOQ02_05685 [Campylobacter coli]|nr:hypothetical protein BOQ02_05685 [Campylobacter coli]
MFISSKTELIQTIKNLTINNKEVKQIDFIYPNFSILHAILKNIDFHQRKILFKNQILAMEILEILKQTCDNHNNIEVNIHTLNELDAGQNVNLKDLSSSEICTKVYLEDLEEEIQDKKQGKDFNLFYHTDKNNLCIEFINTLKELAKDSEDITTLDELIENIDPDDISSEKFDDFKKKVLEKIGNVIESDFFKNSISPTLKNTYEKFIDELLEHIKKLAEEKEYEKIKIILSAIAGVTIATVVAVLTGGAGLAILAAGLFSLMGSASEYYEFAQRDYGTLLTPLAAFLATRCAMFIHYINSRLLSCVLIIDKKEIIDLSGFGLYLGSDESNIASNLAYKITLSEEIKSIENIFSEIFLNPEQKDNESKNTANDSKSSNLPAFISTQKLSNLYLKNNAILKNLQEDIKQFIYFSYIESPNFNSSKLAEFFAQKNQNTQIDLNTTKMSKNYLIISNIPNKYNAGLSESLTQEIANYNIQDKYRTIKKNIDTSKKTYDSTRDYSEYSIEMPQDENEPYILQLSPFVKISKEAYENSKKAYEDMQEIYKDMKESHEDIIKSAFLTPVLIGKAATAYYLYESKSNYDDYNKKINDKKWLPYFYIKKFFKQNEDKESFIEKEKKLAHQYLTFLKKEFFEKSDKSLFGNYSLMECLFISFVLYQAKLIFPNINLDLKKYVRGNSVYIKYLNKPYLLWREFRVIFVNNKPTNITAYEVVSQLLKILDKKDYSFVENDSSITIDDFFNELSKDLDTTNTLDKEIIKLKQIYHSDKQEYAKEFMNLDEETQQTFVAWMDIEKQISDLSKLLEQMYGKEYLNKAKEQKTSEIFTYAMLKILLSASPFISFTAQMLWDFNFLKTIEYVIQACIKINKEGFKEFFKEQLGIFAPPKKNSIYHIHIKSNLIIKARLQQIEKELTHTKIQMILAQEIKSNLIIQKNTSSLNLFITKIKEYFNEKQIKIYWSDKYMKQLFIYSNQESNVSKIALMHSIDIQTQKYTIYTYAKLNKLDLASIVAGEFVGIFLNYLFPTNFKALQEQYESIVYQLYTFKDDSPLAVIRDHFITYPFAINSKFISFDLKKIFYGIDLCTGVFDTHFSFHYEIDQKLEENKEFLLKRLLSYLIIDEKRSATALEDIKEQKYIIDDYTFYFKELKSLELKKCTIYQLPCNHPLFKEFRNKEKQISAFKKDEDSPIHAYNEALQILQDFANGIYNTSKDKTGKCIEDKNKTRRLLEKLNIIGQNNLKAMYMGINGNEESLKAIGKRENNISKANINADIASETKAPPNFIGRLATTIIIEDGLYIG